MQQQIPAQLGSAYQTIPPANASSTQKLASTDSDQTPNNSTVTTQSTSGPIAFALGLAIVGFIFAIASARVQWLSFTVDQEFRYSPFQLKICNRRGECRDPEKSVCETITKIKGFDDAGNFCSLDQNLKGFTITAIIFAFFGIYCFGYILAVGKVAPKPAFFVGGVASLLSMVMASCAIGMSESIKSIPLFTRNYIQAPKNEEGPITECLALILMLLAGGVALVQSRFAPDAVDLQNGPVAPAAKVSEVDVKTV
ncbi:hypothetical protein HDU97_004951 [Phlyctochytrium planicorne]|nr:hypothetical protein HDU97_004951 [Phlyctochytrium planicorne]